MMTYYHAHKRQNGFFAAVFSVQIAYVTSDLAVLRLREVHRERSL